MSKPTNHHPAAVLAIGIDPGLTQSGLATLCWSGLSQTISAGVFSNSDLVKYLTESAGGHVIAIEMFASYGMRVGLEVFQTCVWIGRFQAAIAQAGGQSRLVPRKTITTHHCHSARANNADIRRQMLNRFGEQGTKKAPGPTYGIKKDAWSALAVAAWLQDGNEAGGDFFAATPLES